MGADEPVGEEMEAQVGVGHARRSLREVDLHEHHLGAHPAQGVVADLGGERLRCG